MQSVARRVWDTHDADKSGNVETEESKKFIQDALGNLGFGDKFLNEALDEVFAALDKDRSGAIEKNEMVHLLKQVVGGL